MASSKPKVFIGSSSEAKKYVTAVMNQLKHHAEVTPWFAGVFKMNNATMDDLERQVDKHDFAIFVFAEDDLVNFRGELVLAPRDNTVFEMGLFWGHLRRERVFFLVPTSTKRTYGEEEITEFHIPSDLQGLTYLTYDTSMSNIEASIVPACGAICDKIDELREFVSPAHLPLISFLTQFSKDLMGEPERKYDHLYEAIRTAYDTRSIAGASVSGAAVWAVHGTEGIKQVAGNVGRDKFYSFEDYKTMGRPKEDTPLVIDVYLTSTEQAMLYKRTGVASVYLLCYPVGKELVVTIHLTVNGRVAHKPVLERLLDSNVELMSSIHYIFGGEVS